MPDELQGQLCMGEVASMIEEHREQQYQAFVDKFKDVKTTDDCYTPPAIYDAIADWVALEYGLDRSRFLRPFRPGGNYQAEEYPDGCAVVDNPPFSILSQIIDWYLDRDIPFFLFCPTLTSLGWMKRPERKTKICVILIGNQITYENGASVNTSYVTNLDTYAVRIEAELRDKLETINEALLREQHRELPKYIYPEYILTGKEYRLAKWGQTLRIRHQDCAAIAAMDAQRASGKVIFGGGLLLSERAAAERAAAERAAAERAAAERAAAERAAAEQWHLSEREKAIIQNLGSGGGTMNVPHKPPATECAQIPGQLTMMDCLEGSG